MLVARSFATVSRERVAYETRPPFLPLLLLLTQHKRHCLSWLRSVHNNRRKGGGRVPPFSLFWGKAHTEHTRGRGNDKEMKDIDLPSTWALCCQRVRQTSCGRGYCSLLLGLGGNVLHSLTNSLPHSRSRATTSMWAIQSKLCEGRQGFW